MNVTRVELPGRTASPAPVIESGVLMEVEDQVLYAKPEGIVWQESLPYSPFAKLNPNYIVLKEIEMTRTSTRFRKCVASGAEWEICLPHRYINLEHAGESHLFFSHQDPDLTTSIYIVSAETGEIVSVTRHAPLTAYCDNNLNREEIIVSHTLSKTERVLAIYRQDGWIEPLPHAPIPTRSGIYPVDGGYVLSDKTGVRFLNNDFSHRWTLPELNIGFHTVQWNEHLVLFETRPGPKYPFFRPVLYDFEGNECLRGPQNFTARLDPEVLVTDSHIAMRIRWDVWLFDHSLNVLKKFEDSSLIGIHNDWLAITAEASNMSALEFHHFDK